MFHRLKSTSPKYQPDWQRVEGLSGLEERPLQTFSYGPAAFWLRKKLETAGDDVEGQKVSHWFLTALQLRYLWPTLWKMSSSSAGESLITLFLPQNNNPCPFMACKCPESPSAVEPREVSLKSCLKQAEFDGPASPLQEPFSGKVDRFSEIMAINSMTICVCGAESLADQFHLLLLNNHFLELLSVSCWWKV